MPIVKQHCPWACAAFSVGLAGMLGAPEQCWPQCRRGNGKRAEMQERKKDGVETKRREQGPGKETDQIYRKKGPLAKDKAGHERW